MQANVTYLSMYRADEDSVHRVCCERATQLYSLGGGAGEARFVQAEDSESKLSRLLMASWLRHLLTILQICTNKAHWIRLKYIKSVGLLVAISSTNYVSEIILSNTVFLAIDNHDISGKPFPFAEVEQYFIGRVWLITLCRQTFSQYVPCYEKVNSQYIPVWCIFVTRRLCLSMSCFGLCCYEKVVSQYIPFGALLLWLFFSFNMSCFFSISHFVSEYVHFGALLLRQGFFWICPIWDHALTSGLFLKISYLRSLCYERVFSEYVLSGAMLLREDLFWIFCALLLWEGFS